MSQATVPPAPPPRTGQSPYSALDRRKHGATSSGSYALPGSSNPKYKARLRPSPPSPSKHKAPTQTQFQTQTQAQDELRTSGGPSSAAGVSPSRSNADSEALKLYANIQPVLNGDTAQEQTPSRSTIALPRPPQQNLYAESISTDLAPSPGRLAPISHRKSLGNTASWDGEQPEDQLSEQIIRDGYSNKPKVQNEMSTARSSLWPHLKAATALTSMSSAFVLALQQRDDRDIVTAASTFKPPPRVTLTDARKTAWLSELSDDSIPLRRLSRTIPHGVRGRILLEQCLQNRIPIARAMWLVKCVGANELRAFRRKGVSDSTVVDNEHKWVLEWTGHVERFLADPTRGQDVTYTSYQYALQITSRIFSEGLVDCEHFLASLYAGVQSATTDDLPFVLLKVETWLVNILSDFNHSYLTMNACLEKINEITHHARREIFQPLLDRLQKLCRKIQSRCPLASLSFHCEDVPQPSIPHDAISPNEDSTLTYVNDLMIYSLRKRSVRLDTTFNFTQKLDFYLKMEPTKLEEPLMKVFSRRHCDLHSTLVTLLEWAASPMRPGESKVYAGLRLFRSLQRKALDIKNPFIRALGEVASSKCISPPKLSHLVAEMARANQIDVSVYLRWLVSTGAMDSSSQAVRAHSAILEDIPTKGLSNGVVSLLNHIRNVPSKRGKGSDAESSLSTLKYAIRQRCLYAKGKSGSLGCSMGPSIPAPWAVKFDISTELLDALKSVGQAKQHQAQPIIEEVLNTLAVTRDEIALVHIVNAHVPTANSDLVRRLCDETASHRHCFAAVGKFDALRIVLLRRYHNLKNVELLDKELATRLLILARAQPKNEQLERHMVDEIERYDQRPGIAAQTPLSDGGPPCEGDSGDANHGELLQAMFGKTTSDQSFCLAITKGLEYAAMHKLDGAQVAAAAKASLERAFSAQPSERSGGNLVSAIARLHGGDQEEGGRSTLFFLLAYNVMPLEDVFSLLEIACRAGVDKSAAVSIDALEILIACEEGKRMDDWPQGDPISARTRCSFHLQTSLFLEQHARGVLHMLLSVVDKAAAGSPADFNRLKVICESGLIVSLNSYAILGTDADLQSFIEPTIKPDMSDEAKTCLEALLVRLMDPDGSSALGTKSTLEKVQFALQNVNGSSASTTRACLALLIKLHRDESLDAAESRARILDIIHAAISEGKLGWATLIDILPPALNVASEARSKAESALLARHGMPTHTDAFKHTPSAFLLDVVRATAASAPASSAALVTAHATERLNALAAGADADAQRTGPVDPDALLTDLTHLLLIHHHSATAAATQPEAPPAFLHALAVLAAGASPGTPRLGQASRLLARATLAFFALELPRPVRAALAASVLPRLGAAADPELRVLLGDGDGHSSGGCGDGRTPAGLVLRSGAGASAPFVRSAWEMPPDAGGEETSVGLRMFGARRVQQ